ADRRDAAHAVTKRAPYVLLLTATPHNGNRDQFASLCEIGAVDDAPLIVFRRTRLEVGLPARRRVHIIRVGATAAERRMHALLMRYAEAGRAARRAPRAPDTPPAPCVPH